MKKTTEYNIEIETHSGSIYAFNIALTKKEVKNLAALVEEKEGDFYVGTFNTLSIEINRYAAFEIIDAWANENRILYADFYSCSDCGEYTPESDPCCGAGIGDDYTEEDGYEEEEDEDY